jgi:hypothetical protein
MTEICSFIAKRLLSNIPIQPMPPYSKLDISCHFSSDYFSGIRNDSRPSIREILVIQQRIYFLQYDTHEVSVSHVLSNEWLVAPFYVGML